MPEVNGLEANPPVPAEWVEMRAPGIEKPYRCAPSAVKHWQSRGWEVTGSAEAPVNAAKVVAREAVVERPADQPPVEPAPEQVADAVAPEGTPNPARRR
jgi:hypothetical protein